METVICTKILRDLSETPGAKFPETTLSDSIVKVARLKDVFSDISELAASAVVGQSLSQKDRKRRKRKGEKKKN